MLVFGAAGFVDTLVSGRLVDRWGAGRTVLVNQVGSVGGAVWSVVPHGLAVLPVAGAVLVTASVRTSVAAGGLRAIVAVPVPGMR